MQALVASIQIIINKIAAWSSWLLAVIKSFFASLFVILGDVAMFLFGGFLGLSFGIVNAIDLGSVSTSLLSFTGVPGEMVEVLNVIGLAPAMDLLISALIIRLFLQLIPFVRLGS